MQFICYLTKQRVCAQFYLIRELHVLHIQNTTCVNNDKFLQRENHGPSEPESFHLWPTIGYEDSVGVCFEQGQVTELCWSSWALWGQQPLSLAHFLFC